MFSQRWLNHCPIAHLPHHSRELGFSDSHTDTCMLIGFPRSGQSLVCDHWRIPLQELCAVGVRRICKRRCQASCRTGLTRENGGRNSATGKKSNCRMHPLAFFPSNLKFMIQCVGKISTIRRKISFLTLGDLCQVEDRGTNVLLIVSDFP